MICQVLQIIIRVFASAAVSRYRRRCCWCWYSAIQDTTAFCSPHSLLIPERKYWTSRNQEQLSSLPEQRKDPSCYSWCSIGSHTTTKQSQISSLARQWGTTERILLSFTSNRWWWLFFPSSPLWFWLPCVGFSAHDLWIVHTMPNSLKLQAENKELPKQPKGMAGFRKTPPVRRCTSSASRAGVPALHCICQPEQDFNYSRKLNWYNFWYKASFNFTGMSVIYIHSAVP